MLSFPDLLSALGALALVLGLIILLRYGTRLLHSMRPRDTSPLFQLKGQLGLDGRRRLRLIQCGSSQVLLLTGGSGDVLLPWPPQPGPPQPGPPQPEQRL